MFEIIRLRTNDIIIMLVFLGNSTFKCFLINCTKFLDLLHVHLHYIVLVFVFK